MLDWLWVAFWEWEGVFSFWVEPKIVHEWILLKSAINQSLHNLSSYKTWINICFNVSGNIFRCVPASDLGRQAHQPQKQYHRPEVQWIENRGATQIMGNAPSPSSITSRVWQSIHLIWFNPHRCLIYTFDKFAKWKCWRCLKKSPVYVCIRIALSSLVLGTITIYFDLFVSPIHAAISFSCCSATIVIKCDMDFVLYPLDVQNCPVDFSSCENIWLWIWWMA